MQEQSRSDELKKKNSTVHKHPAFTQGSGKDPTPRDVL